MGGRELVSFCSNDYLGLANDRRVVDALRRGAEQFGVGSGASHLVTGHHRAHAALEVELAEHVGAERALVFSTGYMANLALGQVFARRGDLVLEDKLNHASLIDAGLSTRAELRRYAHADAGQARQILAKRDSDRRGGALVLSDAVFSMDGDIAPVKALISAADAHDALLALDDAHGLGVHGPGGRGTLARCGDAPRGRVLVMGTLGKALGTFGAFVAGDDLLIETLLQTARTYIYTTALPPALAEAARTALAIAGREDWRRESLGMLIDRFRRGAGELGLELAVSGTPIQPVLVGESGEAVRLSEGLRDLGFLVAAIRPPTVPKGTARLRVTLCADHTPDDIDRLLSALDTVRRRAAGVGAAGRRVG